MITTRRFTSLVSLEMIDCCLRGEMMWCGGVLWSDGAGGVLWSDVVGCGVVGCDVVGCDVVG